MPAAIVVFSDVIPSFYYEPSDKALFWRLQSIKDASHVRSVEDAKAWLSTLALPSGWFASPREARAFAYQCTALPKCTMRGVELSSIREMLGLSRADFAAAIGFEGNSNTAHKQIFEMENDTKKIMPARALAARALYAVYLATSACTAG